MGMYAEVICIGPFSKDIAQYLEYNEERYTDTLEGAIISVTLFGVSEGNTLSRELAVTLGISDAWDFNQHKIDKNAINFTALELFVETNSIYAKDANALEVLSKNGFEFHFVPNG